MQYPDRPVIWFVEHLATWVEWPSRAISRGASAKHWLCLQSEIDGLPDQAGKSQCRWLHCIEILVLSLWSGMAWLTRLSYSFLLGRQCIPLFHCGKQFFIDDGVAGEQVARSVRVAQVKATIS